MTVTNWMVDYKRQTEWIDGHGFMVWASVFLGVLGSAGFIVALFIENYFALLLFYIVMAVKDFSHVLHCKYPLRLLRMVKKIRTSWLARGTLISLSFAGFGFILMALMTLQYFNLFGISELGIPLAAAIRVLQGICGLLAFLTCVYEGFMVNYLRSIPIWNNALVPVLYFGWGGAGGFGITALCEGLRGNDIKDIVTWYAVTLIITLFCTVLFLINAYYAGAASKESAYRMLHGSLGRLFIIGCFVAGLIIPLAILAFAGGTGIAGWIVLAICGVAGVFVFLYCLFKAAVYNPMV